MIARSLPDFTGDNAAHTLASQLATPITDGRPVHVRWIHFLADATNAVKVVRVGAGEVDSTHGYPLAAGKELRMEGVSMASEMYDLSIQKIYADTGAKVYIITGA